MYLSRIFLDEQNRKTMGLMASPELMHGAVEGCFPEGRQRRLWRLDRLDSRYCLWIVSLQEPDCTTLAARYGFPGEEHPWQTKAYRPLLERLQPGQAWHFRLRANPVRSVKEEGQGRGKVMAHVTIRQQKEWLLKRAEDCGFALEENAFEVVHTQWARFQKRQGHWITLRTASYEGRLTIVDKEVFTKMLLEGLGRAKAYGCGMMTLAPLRGNQDA